MDIPSTSVSSLDRIRNTVDAAYNKIVYGRGRLPKLRFYGSANTSNSLLWLLGSCYNSGNKDDYDKFLEDFQKLLLFSYRSDFAPILHFGKTYKSDAGWGCTLRSAQMMVAHALSIVTGHQTFATTSNAHRIIRLFEDCDDSPLGIHTILRLKAARSPLSTRQCNWFSPSEAISLLREAMLVDSVLSSTLSIHLSVDGNVVLEEVEESSKGWSRGVAILLCLRLGTKRINEIYQEKLQDLFSLKSCLGVIGGKPKRAVYIVGCMDELYCLDPHLLQRYLPLGDDDKLKNELEEGKKWATFHCQKPPQIPMSELDPSITVGFLVRSRAELDSWVEQLTMADIVHKHSPEGEVECDHQTPVLFSIVESRKDFIQDFTHPELTRAGSTRSNGSGLDEAGFIVL